MRVFARLMFGLVSIASRRGIIDEGEHTSTSHPSEDRKRRAWRTGIRGETFAYWYLRRHGYVIIATNYSVPEMKGEVDVIGYDGGSSHSLRSKRGLAKTHSAFLKTP